MLWVVISRRCTCFSCSGTSGYFFDSYLYNALKLGRKAPRGPSEPISTIQTHFSRGYCMPWFVSKAFITDNKWPWKNPSKAPPRCRQIDNGYLKRRLFENEFRRRLFENVYQVPLQNRTGPNATGRTVQRVPTSKWSFSTAIWSWASRRHIELLAIRERDSGSHQHKLWLARRPYWENKISAHFPTPYGW